MVWRPAPGRQYGALNQLVGGFTEGYDTMSKWVREHREEEDKQKARKSRELMAELAKEGPQVTSTAIPAASYENRAGTDHPGRVTTHQTAGRTITQKDWDKFLESGMSAAIQSGDFEKANAWKEYVTGVQHRGAMQYGGQALAALQAGNSEQAAELLNQANQYFPNGASMVYDNINGQLVAMGIDEQTGKPRGEPVAVTQEYLTRVLANMQEPEKFFAWLGDQEERALDKEKFAALKDYRTQTLGLEKARDEATADYRAGRLALGRDELAATQDYRDQQYAVDLMRLGSDKDYRDQTLAIERQKIEAANERARIKAGLAKDAAGVKAANKAADYALKVFEDVNDKDFQLATDLGYAPAEIARMASALAMDNPSASAAEIHGVVMETLRRRAEARAAALAEDTSTRTGPGGVAIPTKGETVTEQVLGDVRRGVGAVGPAVAGALSPTMSPEERAAHEERNRWLGRPRHTAIPGQVLP